MTKRYVFYTVLMIFLLFSSVYANEITGECTNIIDGDTIIVRTNGRYIKVRLYGMDAPEKKQEYGYESKIALQKLILNKNLTILDKGFDKYGRTIGIIFIGEVNINLTMLQEGHAWWYERYCNDIVYKNAQNEAKLVRKGLWKGNPIPPWEYRKENR